MQHRSPINFALRNNIDYFALLLLSFLNDYVIQMFGITNYIHVKPHSEVLHRKPSYYL